MPPEAAKKEEEEQTVDRRSALAEAFDESEERGSDEDTEEQVGDTEEEETSDEVDEGDDEDGGDEDEESSGEDEPASEEEESDDEEDTEGEEGDEEDGEESSGRAADDDESGDTRDTGRAPASWSPSLRERWKDLPKDVKQQITKREREISQALGQATNARRLEQEFNRVVQPFEGLIRAEGAQHPLQAVERLMHIGAGLRLGSQAQKSQILANLVKQYDVDIEALDSALSGQTDPKAAQSDTIRREIQQALQPYQQQWSQQQQQQQEAARNEVANELQQFAEDPKNEFYDDVRDDMADLIEVAAKRGKVLSLQDAYDQACNLNPEIKAIVDQRKKAAASKKNGKRRRQKKAASSSIRGKAGGSSENKAEFKSRRDAIAAAMDKSGRRFSKRI